MATEKDAAGILRRDLFKVAGVGALAVGMGANVANVTGASNLLDQTNIDPKDAIWLPMLEDLQGNILASHGRNHSALMFLEFGPDQAATKQWLRNLAQNDVTSAKIQAEEAERYRQANVPGGLFASCALSAAGYRALGFSLENLPLDRSFLQGLSSNEDWEAGYQNGTQGIHALILLADDNREKLDSEVRRVRQEVEKVADVLQDESGNRLQKDGHEVEPFGYADNVSQPLFVQRAIDAAKQQGTDKWDPSAKLGLVLVRDPNAPHAHSFGSYLVFQKLEQNVSGFKKRLRELAAQLDIDVELAGALAMGRFRDGTPVTLQSTPGAQRTENFNYADDRAGTKCPFHAHIRKTNPRGDTVRLLPTGVPFEEERRHRIVRRSVIYGTQDVDADPRLQAEAEHTEGVGLLFMCYQSDVGNQFEFLQDQWSDQLNFVRQKTGLDPIVGRGKQVVGGQLWHKKWGGQPQPTDVVSFDFSGFVSLRGGGYFFVPSLSFLKNI